MAAIPVPVGCEELPVTEGSLRDERTNMKAPATASRGTTSLLSLTSLFNLYIPYSITGIENTNHNCHQGDGKKPSNICIICHLPFLNYNYLLNHTPSTMLNEYTKQLKLIWIQSVICYGT
jgi:hypothetical protein